MTLRVNFVLWLALIGFIASVIPGAGLLYLEHQFQITQLNEELRSIKDNSLPAIEASVWALDQTQTQRLANSIFAQPNIEYVKIEGNGINTITLGSALPGSQSIPTELQLTHSMDNRPHTIGLLTVHATTAPIIGHLKNMGYYLFAAIALQLLIILTAAGILLQSMIVNHLRNMVQYFKKVPPLIGAKALNLEKLEHNQNELAQLQQEINQFRRTFIQNEVKNISELRKYAALAQNNSEIIWRCDFNEPIDLTLPKETQTELIFSRGQLANLNTPAKNILQPNPNNNPNHIKNLPFLKDNVIEWLTHNNYRVKDIITSCDDEQGSLRYFRNSLACWIEQGKLQAIWGIAVDVTQSLTTQKALEQREQQLYLSQTRLSEAQALAHMGHWSYFTETNKLQVSDEFARIYGFDPDSEQTSWKEILNRIHPDDKSYVVHTLSDPRTQAAGAEHRILWSNGEVRFVQAITRKTVINNKVESTFGILIDITDRRRAEEERSKSQRALAESEARLAQAQAIAHMGHWLLDCKSQKLLCSDEFYRLLGLSPQERQLDQQTFIEFVHHDDHPLINHLLISAREKSFTNEFRVTRRDGAQRFMRGTFTPFYAGGKSSARIFGIMMDVTEQKQAELELRASQELFATAFDSSPDGIFFISSSDSKFLKVNNAFATMLDSNEAELLEKTFASLPMYMDQPVKRHMIDFVKLQRSATNVEVHVEKSKTEIISGLASWQHVTIANNPFVLGIIHDVTPLRQLQKTADEQQKQLIQADKLASIGTMVAGVAHEINNPNHLIQMNAELLEGFSHPMMTALDDSNAAKAGSIFNGLNLNELKEAIPELLADVKVSSQRISRIVSDLKDFARPQENSEYVPTQLNDVIEKTLNLLSALLEKSHAKLSTQLEPKLPNVLADSQRLEQVLVNLIMNALEACEKKSKPILVRSFVSPDKDYVVCEIEDHGYGIPDEAMLRIFDPFFTTKQDKGGTGLGLAISYRLIQEHGGTIAAQINEKGGTTMMFKLPIATKFATRH